ncbi:arginine metabolism regulation protein II [Sporothrix bragantina]|uniref:Arginine metabolism regulation protein II n=1 Tax=Sporothrix bragantina TaxID=671064 RepID=A0ABP0CRS5_9PEZI
MSVSKPFWRLQRTEPDGGRCWTCRSRKVKCDERETNGCGVCERAGLTCAGFQVSLCWVQSGQKQQHSSSAPGPRRRGIKLHRHTGPVMTDGEIMRALSTIDATLSPKKTKTIGPFAVFQADSYPGDNAAQSTDNIPGGREILPEALPAPVSDDFLFETVLLEPTMATQPSEMMDVPSSPAIDITTDTNTDFTMAGEDSDFPVHLKACYQLKKPSGTAGMSNGGSTNQIYSICRFLTLLARTTSPVIVARPWRGTDDGFTVFTGPGFDDNERSVEYMYGITPALGNMLAKTCQMAEHLAYYHQQCEDYPLQLQQACTKLGDEIASWAVDKEPFVLIEAEEHSMREIARCQARAFQGAVLIYYCQTLQKYGLQESVSPVAVDVQSQVQVIWAQLTTAEDLKDSYTGGLKRSAPMSWPAFLAACESSRCDREIWVEWWERVNGYHIGNFARQWQIIQDVWDMQDAVEETSQISISWRDALAQTGKLVLPI